MDWWEENRQWVIPVAAALFVGTIMWFRTPSWKDVHDLNEKVMMLQHKDAEHKIREEEKKKLAEISKKEIEALKTELALLKDKESRREIEKEIEKKLKGKADDLDVREAKLEEREKSVREGEKLLKEKGGGDIVKKLLEALEEIKKLNEEVKKLRAISEAGAAKKEKEISKKEIPSQKDGLSVGLQFAQIEAGKDFRNFWLRLDKEDKADYWVNRGTMGYLVRHNERIALVQQGYLYYQGVGSGSLHVRSPPKTSVPFPGPIRNVEWILPRSLAKK